MDLLENYQKRIVDGIQKINYIEMYDKTRFEDAKLRFSEEIKTLIALDKKVFESAVLSLLNDTVEYLNLDETAIKLECVGIYGKRNFRINVYRLCYDFGILNREATDILKKELKQLYQSKDEYTKDDILHYSLLIYDIYNNNLISQEDKESLKDAITLNDINTFNDLSLYFELNPNSRFNKTIQALDNIALIQNMGLVYWGKIANLNDINNVKKVLLKYGFDDDVIKCLDDYLTTITPIKKEKRIPYESEIEEMEQINDTFLTLLDIDAIDTITLKIVQSLKSKSK